MIDSDLGPSTSQSSRGVSFPVNIDARGGKCTRCGRATEAENTCDNCGSCQGSHPSAGIVAGPSNTTTTVNRNPHCQLTVAAICTTCRATLQVPSHYRFETDHIICPPCQSQHNAIVEPNTFVRTNPYPVVMPMPKTSAPTTTTPRVLASTVAFMYPQCPVPSAISMLSVPSVAPRRGDALRVCMRFGCGAPIPMYVLGHMCETCVRAGFVHPPLASPPVVVPKNRVRRHMMERPYPCPREAVGVVHASSLREAVRPEGATVAVTECADVRDESEVDLRYPDEDIPITTQRPTTSKSKGEESNTVEDVDDDLNLVYPDDVAEAVCASLPKPQTQLSQPTTLRELFRKDSLQTIPPLQDLAALMDKKPPRHCRTLGCNEVLPAQTNMERCVRCSINYWKRRRRLSSVAVLDPSRRPSTTSSVMTATVEEKEVGTVLLDVSDVEEESDASSPSPSPSKGSSDVLTGEYGIRPIPSWDSDLTELSSLGSESEDTSDSDSDSELGETFCKPERDTTGLKIHIPLLVTRLPPGILLRKCGNKKCNIALPKDHRWKTCDPCRRAQRMYQKIRFENLRRRMVGFKTLKPPDQPRRWRSLSPEMHEMILTHETSRSCTAKGCQNRIPLPEVYRWKTCAGCRTRARRGVRQKRDAGFEAQGALRQPEEVVPRFPAYQNRGALLASFDAQLRGFVEGQIMYLRAKLPLYVVEGGGQGRDSSQQWKPENAPMLFVFVGEYSIVTGQRDDSEGEDDTGVSNHAVSSNDLADLEAMRREVSSVVLELERLLRAKFRTGEAFSIDRGGVIMPFTSSLQLIAQLRPLATTFVGPSPASDSEVHTNADKGKDMTTAMSSEDASLTPSLPRNTPATVPLVKTLSGELEAVVVPDESHHLFHGRRVVIRYRMVG